MLTFRDITLADRELVMPMVQAFYQTDAVDHPVDQAILDRSFLAAAVGTFLSVSSSYPSAIILALSLIYGAR